MSPSAAWRNCPAPGQREPGKGQCLPLPRQAGCAACRDDRNSLPACSPSSVPSSPSHDPAFPHLPIQTAIPPSIESCTARCHCAPHAPPHFGQGLSRAKPPQQGQSRLASPDCQSALHDGHGGTRSPSPVSSAARSWSIPSKKCVSGSAGSLLSCHSRWTRHSRPSAHWKSTSSLAHACARATGD